jgi:O-antigen/teichoic acid export membrane protein
VQIVNILISIIRTKLTAVFIGAAGLGLADLLSRSAEFLGYFSQGGLHVSGIRRIAQVYEEDGHSARLLEQIAILRSWVMLTALLGMMLTLAVAPAVAHFLLDDQGSLWMSFALAPLVAISALLGGEITILKATHQLKKLALCTAGGAVTTLIIATSLYATLGISGVMPVLILCILSLFCIHLYATTRHYPYRLRINREGIRDGLPIIRLGISFAFTGVIASGAEVFVRYFIKSQASDAEVGFYAAAFTLVVSYSRIIFAAVDADYYPRLSAIVENQQEMNTIVNRQINALVMLMTPFLIGFSIALPFIVSCSIPKSSYASSLWYWQP